jgi:hypothetical protein
MKGLSRIREATRREKICIREINIVLEELNDRFLKTKTMSKQLAVGKG